MDLRRLSDPSARIEGEREGDWLGDVDGDGLDDFGIGAPNTDTGATWTGTVYIVGGAREWPSPSMDLADAGIAVHGVGSYERIQRVAAASDVDGDGLPDLLLGRPQAGLEEQGEGRAAARAPPDPANAEATA